MSQQRQMSKELLSNKQNLDEELSTAKAQQGELNKKLIQAHKELREENSSRQQAVKDFDALKNELGALQRKFDDQVHDM